MGKWQEVIESGVPQPINFETDREAFLELQIDLGKGMITSSMGDPITKFHGESTVRWYENELREFRERGQNEIHR